MPAGCWPADCSACTSCCSCAEAVLRLQGFRQLFVALFVMPEERKVSHRLGVASGLSLSMPASMPASTAVT